MDYRYDKENQKTWFPYYVSDKKIDYIFPTGVHFRCSDGRCKEDCQKENPNYWKNILNLEIPKHFQIGCYGCSNTAGPNLRLDQTWPGHLSKMIGRSTANFGVPMGGLDSIFYNLRASFRDHEMRNAIILLPNFERRLLEIERNGLYLRHPVSIHTQWVFDSSVAKDLINKSEIIFLIREIKKNIVNDIDNTYSKKKLDDIISFCKENQISLQLSSWDKEVYTYVKKNYTSYTLPIFDLSWPFKMMLDMFHPGPDFHYYWAKSIKEQINY